jgi:glycosyltransferase involved in cell wall biosynthesis
MAISDFVTPPSLERYQNIKLSVVVPVYNEIATIEIILKEILSVPIPKEVIIVDDGSSDGTREVLKNLKRTDCKVFFHEKNQGKGAAVRTGLSHIDGDIIIIQDADLEYPPHQYLFLLAPIVEGKADVVYGTRFVGVHRVFMFWHYMANKALTFLTNLLYNTMLTDMETGYKVFRRRALEGITIRSDHFNFEPEITAKIFKKKNLRIVEVPIEYYGRNYSEGKKIGWKDGFSALWTLLKYRFTD